MDAPLAFINYRRQDSAAAARWLRASIAQAFGPTSAFMDRDELRVGVEWEKELEAALARATALVVVIGPHWLTIADENGRRRIDDPKDWVHREIKAGLKRKCRIIPLLLADTAMPKPEALPRALRKLAGHQAFWLRDDSWWDDLARLMRGLDGASFNRTTQDPIHYPSPRIRIREMSTSEIQSLVKKFPRWKLAQTGRPGEEPLSRTELSGRFEFPSFEKAMSFMQEAAEHISVSQHHPRWKNIWKTTTVWLSTWDIGHKPSQLDTELAKTLERIAKRHEAIDQPKRRTGRG
jgi:pterin-4a-carbinolamine dehydratase